MIAEERFDDVADIGLVTAFHHRRQTVLGDRRAGRKLERREGQGRRAVEIAGHEEAAGRQHGQRMVIGAGGAQIGGEGGGEAPGAIFIGGDGIALAQFVMPGAGERGPVRLARHGERLA